MRLQNPHELPPTWFWPLLPSTSSNKIILLLHRAHFFYFCSNFRSDQLRWLSDIDYTFHLVKPCHRLFWLWHYDYTLMPLNELWHQFLESYKTFQITFIQSIYNTQYYHCLYNAYHTELIQNLFMKYYFILKICQYKLQRTFHSVITAWWNTVYRKTVFNKI